MISPGFYVLICGVGVIAYFFAGYHAHERGRLLSKMCASAAFVLCAVEMGATDTTAGILILLGLVASLVGDFFLLRSETHFMEGVYSFVVAHLLYAAGFVASGLDLSGVGFGLVIFAPVAWAIWSWVKPHTGDMFKHITLYICLIFLMTILALSACWDDPGKGQQLLLVSAVVFCASDVLVARQKFVHPQTINEVVGLPVYYAAQLGFAFGAGLL